MSKGNKDGRKKDRNNSIKENIEEKDKRRGNNQENKPGRYERSCSLEKIKKKEKGKKDGCLRDKGIKQRCKQERLEGTTQVKENTTR